MGVAIAQVHDAPPGVAVVIQVRQAATAGVLHLVFGDLEAQQVAVELQRPFEIAHTERHM